MSRTESIYREVAAFVTDRIEAGLAVRVDWLTAEYLAEKHRIGGDDLPFYTVCAHHHIREIARQCIGRYKPRPESDAQLVLDGFEHLQKAYPVVRDGERLLVPVHLLSDDELEVRALEYTEMAKGCVAHAKEIRAFLRLRGADAA